MTGKVELGIVEEAKSERENRSHSSSTMGPISRRWRVDRFHSYLFGQAFAELSLPRRSHALVASKEWQIWTELLTVSICHQANWDRLHSRIIEIAQTELSLIHPVAMSKITNADFRRLFGQAYDSDRLRSGERARLLRTLAESIETNAEGPVFSWLTSMPLSLGGSSGLYEWLRSMEAFREDPLQKKARVLVHDLLQFELIEVADPQNIAPAIDYHLIRYYVRTGRVLPVRNDLLARLSDEGTPRVEFHLDLRAAVEEAMGYTASGASLRLDQLNHIEWQIARSFCVRKNPRCYDRPIAEKPIDPTLEVLASRIGGCPGCPSCRGASDEKLRSIVDPRSASSFY